MHLVGFIIRIYNDAQSCQIRHKLGMYSQDQPPPPM